MGWLPSLARWVLCTTACLAPAAHVFGDETRAEKIKRMSQPMKGSFAAAGMKVAAS